MAEVLKVEGFAGMASLLGPSHLQSSRVEGGSTGEPRPRSPVTLPGCLVAGHPRTDPAGLGCSGAVG